MASAVGWRVSCDVMSVTLLRPLGPPVGPHPEARGVAASGGVALLGVWKEAVFYSERAADTRITFPGARA